MFHEDQVFKDLKLTAEQAAEKVQEVGQSSGTSNIEIIAERSSKEQQHQQQPDAEGFSQGGVAENDSSESKDEVVEQDEEDAIDIAGYQLARDRSPRVIVPPARFTDYSMVAFTLLTAEVLNLEEPQCYHEARDSVEWLMWNGSMDEEMTSLVKNGTCVIVDRPEGKKFIGCRWLYRKKPGIPGVESERYKSMLVVRGFT